MNKILIRRLRDYRLSLEAVYSKLQTFSEVPFAFYDFLESLLLMRPIEADIDTPHLLEMAPSHLHNFLIEAGFPFGLAPTVNALETFMEQASQPRWRGLPEVGLLKSAAEMWVAALAEGLELQNELLRIGITPSLDLAVMEETDVGDSTVQTVLPIMIINIGKFPVWRPVLRLSVVGVAESLEIDGAELRDMEARWEIGELLAGGNLKHMTIRVRHDGEVLVRINVEYFRIVAGNTLESTEEIGVTLHARAVSVKLSRDEMGNPFTPDLPLASREQWVDVAKGEHRAIVNNICGELAKNQGRLYVVHGLRRTGKTTLLHWIASALEDRGQNFLPVYIDIRLWYRALISEDKSLGAANIFYEIAESTVAAAVRLLPLDDDAVVNSAREKLGTILKDAEQSLSLPADLFAKAVRSVKEITGRNVVILVDELDWWLNQGPFPGDAQEILRPLGALSGRARELGVILSHDWTSSGWNLRYQKDDLTILPWRIPLLNKREMTELVRISPVAFSDLAIEFVWLLTGGWPGVVHLLCYEAIRQFQRDTVGCIDISFAKKVASYLLSSQDYRSFFLYFMDGLRSDEKEVLAALTRSGLISSESGGLIEGVRYSPNEGYLVRSPDLIGGIDLALFSRAMRVLREKEIIEAAFEGAEQCRLRVGFLGYPAIDWEGSLAPHEVVS